MTLRNDAPYVYLGVEFWEDGKWHGTCYRHKPLPGPRPNNDIPRYVFHLSTTEGYEDPREASAAIMKRCPDLPSPLEGITDDEIALQIAEAKKLL